MSMTDSSEWRELVDEFSATVGLPCDVVSNALKTLTGSTDEAGAKLLRRRDVVTVDMCKKLFQAVPPALLSKAVNDMKTGVVAGFSLPKPPNSSLWLQAFVGAPQELDPVIGASMMKVLVAHVGQLYSLPRRLLDKIRRHVESARVTPPYPDIYYRLECLPDVVYEAARTLGLPGRLANARVRPAYCDYLALEMWQPVAEFAQQLQRWSSGCWRSVGDAHATALMDSKVAQLSEKLAYFVGREGLAKCKLAAAEANEISAILEMKELPAACGCSDLASLYGGLKGYDGQKVAPFEVPLVEFIFATLSYCRYAGNRTEYLTALSDCASSISWGTFQGYLVKSLASDNLEYWFENEAHRS